MSLMTPIGRRAAQVHLSCILILACHSYPLEESQYSSSLLYPELGIYRRLPGRSCSLSSSHLSSKLGMSLMPPRKGTPHLSMLSPGLALSLRPPDRGQSKFIFLSLGLSLSFMPPRVGDNRSPSVLLTDLGLTSYHLCSPSPCILSPSLRVSFMTPGGVQPKLVYLDHGLALSFTPQVTEGATYVHLS